MKPLKEMLLELPEVITGTFSKPAAAEKILQGCRHLHSSPLGDSDPCVRITQQSLRTNEIPTFPWELNPKTEELVLASSVNRQSLIQQVLHQSGAEAKRHLREKVSCVLEELLTNSLYHAYHTPAGKEKYERRNPVTLGTNELITIRYFHRPEGLFLSVQDQGGTLQFHDVANSLHRCYTSADQIEAKESGAGLGTYLIFDAVTHLKIVTSRTLGTLIQCWISDQKSFDPENFSFNFFERR